MNVFLTVSGLMSHSDNWIVGLAKTEAYLSLFLLATLQIITKVNNKCTKMQEKTSI